MGDGPARVTLTLNIGSRNQIGREAGFFAGGDSVEEVMVHARNFLGEAMTDELVGKLIETVGDPFDIAQANLARGGVQSVSDPDAPVCKHGARTKRTGTNARGAWTGYFCPLPKGNPEQCKAEFA